MTMGFVALPVTSTNENVWVHMNRVTNVKTANCTKLPYAGVTKILGWTQKVSTEAQFHPAVETVRLSILGLVGTASNSSKWGAPPSAPQCTTFPGLLFPAIIMKLGFLWHCM